MYYNASMLHPLYDFDYYLPKEHIAQSPANPRESAKLMIVNRRKRSIAHGYVHDLPDIIRSNDLVVVNNTKVFRARLHGKIGNSPVELFLVRPVSLHQWVALGKPGKKYFPGAIVHIAAEFKATVEEKRPDGTLIVTFPENANEIMNLADRYGSIPVPPYIKRTPLLDEYQTVYASRVGSVAAPTAGFHMTKNILSRLKTKGAEVHEITLHVGLGTFLPVKTDSIEEHVMHSEWVSVSKTVAQSINQARREARRIVAVGTTTVRTLEGVAAHYNGKLEAFEGDINLFIKPGFQFQAVDALLTNFHLPKSTLLILVSAFAERKFILSAYNEAVKNNYRFFSFGDAMFIE